MVVERPSRERIVGLLLVVVLCTLCGIAFTTSYSNVAPPRSVSSEFSAAGAESSKREVTTTTSLVACPTISPAQRVDNLVPINATEWCPDIVWLQPSNNASNYIPSGALAKDEAARALHRCLGICLEDECCAKFTLLTASSSSIRCDVSHHQMDQPLAPAGVLTVHRWSLVGTRDWSYNVPTTSHTGLRLRVTSGPHQFVVPSPTTGRWRGSAIELQILDDAASLVMSAGGVRTQLINRTANAVLEEIETDVERGAVHSVLEFTFPSGIARPADYVVRLLFAPLHRSSRFPGSIWIEIPFTVMPPVVALQMSIPSQRGSSETSGCLKLRTVDGTGAPSWASADGNAIARIWYTPNKRNAYTGTKQALEVGAALLVRGRGSWCPYVLPHQTQGDNGAPQGGSVFATLGPHTSEPVAMPVSMSSLQSPEHSTVVVVSLSASSCRSQCKWKPVARPLLLPTTMIVVTCDSSSCPPEAWGASCLLVGDCHNSQFLDHRVNVLFALTAIPNATIEFVFMDARVTPTELMEQLLAANPVGCATNQACGAAFRLVSPRFTSSMDQCLSNWRVPEDTDRYPLEAPWWRDVVGKRWMGSWAANRSRIALCAPCFVNEAHDCALRMLGVPGAVAKLLWAVDTFFDASKDTSCYPFASFLIVLMSTLSE